MAATATALPTPAPPAPRAARLRRADPYGPGIRRVRTGRGFRYLDEDGSPVDDQELLRRIDELVIPPAWEQVWICPHPGGHIQATGVDKAGRKQYLYHPRWRARRDAQKFDDMVAFARVLPALRERVAAELARPGLDRTRVLACAVRLLDRGFFRIGSEDYAVRNETYGLATMRKEHVRLLSGNVLRFEYPSKHGKRQLRHVIDAEAAEVVAALKRRRGGGPELLAYKDGRTWRDVKSGDINDFLKETTGLDASAKDFRTWNATVLAAVALAVAGDAPATRTGRRRAITRAVGEVAYYLGNTPAVARASYIDPRLFDAYGDGRTIDPRLLGAGEDAPAIHGPVEDAVLELLNAR
jgi:DNA topoisomerase IB